MGVRINFPVVPHGRTRQPLRDRLPRPDMHVTDKTVIEYGGAETPGVGGDDGERADDALFINPYR